MKRKAERDEGLVAARQELEVTMDGGVAPSWQVTECVPDAALMPCTSIGDPVGPNSSFPLVFATGRLTARARRQQKWPRREWCPCKRLRPRCALPVADPTAWATTTRRWRCPRRWVLLILTRTARRRSRRRRRIHGSGRFQRRLRATTHRCSSKLESPARWLHPGGLWWWLTRPVVLPAT